MKITKFDLLQDFNIAVQQHNIKTSRKPFSNLFDIKKLCAVVSSLMDFVKILSGESIHQEMKILKILSFYHVCFRNYDHLKYGPSNLYTEPLRFLSF